jgi:2-oxoglutarate/2-oxoacid ferredoxin oxidoreductase subunit beta
MAEATAISERGEKKVFGRPSSLSNLPFPYCPGCGHGVVHRMIAEAIEELEIGDRTVMVTSIGCSVRMWRQFGQLDVCQPAHGRAPAAATGIKRALPDSIVFAYQGDGDMAAIGTAEAIHSAARGEKIAIFFVNNAIFGATGGQMAPTTLVGQTTTTSPWGRMAESAGHPIRMTEMLATLEGPTYLERVSTVGIGNLNRAKRATLKAMQIQKEGRGFAMVEYLVACPSGWHMTPVEAQKWIETTMTQYYPLGVFKDRG